MFRLRNIIVCWGRDEDELPSGLPFSPIDINDTDTSYLDMIDGSKSAREPSPSDEKQNKAGALRDSESKWASSIVSRHTIPRFWDRRKWDIGAAPRVQLSVLNDWATALHTDHVSGILHGNLTPRSVSVARGRGTLRCPSHSRHTSHCVLWAREPPDDVYGARWAATELFRIDEGNPSPTKMSDVYSFACLMLQVLTGEVPYCGTKRAEQVVYLKYLGREPIDSQTPQVAAHYVAFMRWCWSPNPKKRPTMERVVDFLREETKKLKEQHS